MSSGTQSALEFLALFNATLLSINTFVTVWNNVLARSVKVRQRRLLDEVLGVATAMDGENDNGR